MAKLLLVEDDKDLALVVAEWLIKQNCKVDVAYDGGSAAQLLHNGFYDLVILDLGLPTMCGEALLQSVRASGICVPILVATGLSHIDSKIDCLDAGADDYITKPFHMRELICRVRALLRRSAGHPVNVLKVSNLCIDIESKTVTKDGLELKVSPQEFSLLEFLGRHPNQPFRSQQLLARVWASNGELNEDAVRTCIKRLRRKLGDCNGTPLIETTSSGYRLYASEALQAV